MDDRYVVRFLVERGIPVCAHLGLTPQTVHALGGYRVQGKTDQAAQALRRQARELRDAGASMLVLEMVPALLSAELTQGCSIATPSALARAAAPQARCWSCTTCWA